MTVCLHTPSNTHTHHIIYAFTLRRLILCALVICVHCPLILDIGSCKCTLHTPYVVVAGRVKCSACKLTSPLRLKFSGSNGNREWERKPTTLKTYAWVCFILCVNSFDRALAIFFFVIVVVVLRLLYAMWMCVVSTCLSYDEVFARWNTNWQTEFNGTFNLTLCNDMHLQTNLCVRTHTHRIPRTHIDFVVYKCKLKKR